ncbi:hypothetical protein EBCG_03903 [Escherichia marmotae]|nr:hypothetical protein EBCG_03903 [Escherichia marmotae]
MPSRKMYRLQENQNSLESASGNGKLPGESRFINR